MFSLLNLKQVVFHFFFFSCAENGFSSVEVVVVEPWPGPAPAAQQTQRRTQTRVRLHRVQAHRTLTRGSAAKAKRCSRTALHKPSRSRRRTRLRTTALPTLRLTTMPTLTSPVLVSRQRTLRCLLEPERPLARRLKALSPFRDLTTTPLISDRRPTGACGPWHDGG